MQAILALVGGGAIYLTGSYWTCCTGYFSMAKRKLRMEHGRIARI